MSFTEGVSVLARLPGSRTYSAGVITSSGSSECSVKFEEGGEYVVPIASIKVTRTYRKSPARTKSPVLGKSPTRNRSPKKEKPTARAKSKERLNKSPESTSRSKSPGRGRSPGRTKTTKTKKAANSSPSRTKRSADSTTKMETETVSRGRNRTRKTDEEVRTARVSPLNSANGLAERVGATIGVMTRRALRSSQSREPEQIVHYKGSLYKGEFSDTENDPEFERKGKSKGRTPDTKSSIIIEKEFGGTIGSILLIPFSIFFPLLLVSYCTREQCSYTSLPKINTIFPHWKTLIDFKVIGFYLAYQLIHAISFILPIGRKIDGPLTKNGKLTYRTNGLLSVLLVLSIVIGLEARNIKIFSVLLQKYYIFLVFSILYGLALALFLYIRSYFIPISHLNIHGSTTSGLYNFFIGREVNPRIFGLFDVKQILFRSALVLVLLINIAIVLKSLGVENIISIQEWKNASVKPASLLIFVISTIYMLDFFVFEESNLGAFETQQEGIGFMMTVGYSFWPWTYCLLPKYLLEHNVKYSLWIIAAIGVLFLIGIILYRASNLQKSEFRKNPYNPSLIDLETIPTPQGKKLLVSGYWGIVRHPNYAADLLIQSSLFLLAPLSPATIMTLPFTLPLLLHRSKRDHHRCKARYGSAWERYCDRVKYVLIPKVY